jgi:aspartyl/asparaginyl beta-hydroxylase (cupin superfamily)
VTIPAGAGRLDLDADRLREWAAGSGVPMRDLRRLEQAARDRPVSPAWRQGQRPRLYVPGIAARPWHDPGAYGWVPELQDSWTELRDELLGVAAQGLATPHPESRRLLDAGRWDTVELIRTGIRNEDNCRACPRTLEAVRRIPGAEESGLVYLSVLEPGVAVKPHCGPHNLRIRCHLGLVTPESCGIRVGGEARTWAAGRCLLFDDSFVHEVWNTGPEPRLVLLLDVWHPELNRAERAAIRHFTTGAAPDAGWSASDRGPAAADGAAKHGV